MVTKNLETKTVDILTLIKLSKNSKIEFTSFRPEVKKLIEGYGIKVLYIGDVVDHMQTNRLKYDIMFILRFKSESSYNKYLESHTTDQMLITLLKAVESRYDLRLEEI